MHEGFNLSEHLVRYAARYRRDLDDSLAFLDWLKKTEPLNSSPTVSWNKEIYRIVYGGYHPLSIAGSLAAGGRFNIGGAQVSALFPNFTMRACLYAASHLNCAKKEAGEWSAMGQEYCLKPKKSLKLWDLEALIEKEFLYKSLKEIVDASPLAARWELQKVPKISQILGHYVRQKGGDGLIYPSTKDPKHQILAFFIEDDQHAEKAFSYS